MSSKTVVLYANDPIAKVEPELYFGKAMNADIKDFYTEVFEICGKWDELYSEKSLFTILNSRLPRPMLAGDIFREDRILEINHQVKFERSYISVRTLSGWIHSSLNYSIDHFESGCGFSVKFGMNRGYAVSWNLMQVGAFTTGKDSKGFSTYAEAVAFAKTLPNGYPSFGETIE